MSAAAPSPAAKRNHTPSTAPATPVLTTGQAQLVARENGGTAGVTQRAGQTVFTSSTAPKVAAKARSTAKKHGVSVHRAPAPSAASAVGDLESGFATSATPTSLAAASAAGTTNGGGLSSSVVAGLVLLALGLVALTGGGAVMVTRSRRARSGSSRTR
ncbi:MAG TPA: hypothetical protein VG294_05455 [Solirubrobacteraceae bacterium]|nr:hypothetical protein [Solirubrobacteraceae bacterium]